MHEIGHAIGFWHEQSRPDRDEYVRIHFENIDPDFEDNFHIVHSINDMSVQYDYRSIMHYGKTVIDFMTWVNRCTN